MYTGRTISSRPPTWVSGSTETKTYGKGATVREREEKQTLPRRGLFGKDVDGRLYLFKDLRIMFFPMEPLFAGKLWYTTIPWWCRGSSWGPDPQAKTPAYKCLKYSPYCATVGFGTLAAANPVCGAFSSRAESSRQGQRPALACGESRHGAWRPDPMSVSHLLHIAL